MAVSRRRKSRKKGGKPGKFRFQLGWGGVMGTAVVVFFLFAWMFLLGIWAGQTILLPSTDRHDPVLSLQGKKEVVVLKPEGKKHPPR